MERITDRGIVSGMTGVPTEPRAQPYAPRAGKESFTLRADPDLTHRCDL
ncbi:hypothetical protein [Methylobacterium nigriterrae]